MGSRRLSDRFASCAAGSEEPARPLWVAAHLVSSVDRLRLASVGDRQLPFACDRYEAEPDDLYFRAIDIAAPAATVFRWLCQLRAAPYSYDLIDNFGRRSPRRLTPGLDRLEVGQRFMTIFELVEFEPDVQITLVLRRLPRLFGNVAGTYLIVPRGAGGCRLVVKLAVRHPGRRAEARLRGAVLPWGDLVMMKQQLANLKAMAEGER